MFYYWSHSSYEIPFTHIAQYCATAPDGRVIVEYYKPDTFEFVLQYHSPSWQPFKYFTINGEVFEHLSQPYLYSDRSFEYRNIHGKAHFGSKATKFTPISPKEAAEKAIYFLNLNPDDPWPLSKGNAYWYDNHWSPVDSFDQLEYDEEADEFVMVPFSEIKAVLKSFGVTND